VWVLKDDRSFVLHKDARLFVTLDGVILHVNTSARMYFDAGETIAGETAAMK
jgi:hypothetical protein